MLYLKVLACFVSLVTSCINLWQKLKSKPR